jgi:hypothetical protein
VADKNRLWGFDDAERRLLFDATTNIAELRAVVERARPRAEIKGVWVVQATARELDEMYSLVEALMDGARGRRRLDLLDGLLASLCASIDGF